MKHLVDDHQEDGGNVAPFSDCPQGWTAAPPAHQQQAASCREHGPADVSSRECAPVPLLVVRSSLFGAASSPFSVGRRKNLWDVAKLYAPEFFSGRRRRDLWAAVRIFDPKMKPAGSPSKSVGRREILHVAAKICEAPENSAARHEILRAIVKISDTK